MNVKNVEKENGSAKVTVETAKVTIEIARDEFQTALDKAYAKIRKDIMIPGFRKGKAPRKFVERMYGSQVFYEDAVNEIFPEIYKAAITEQEIKAVGQPSVTDMQTPEDGSVVLTVSTELYPEVTLGEYKGIEVPKESVSISKAEVDAELARMQERNARIETVDREAKTGDTVVLDFEGFVDGKPFDGGKAEGYSLELGSNSFVPGFEDQVVGMKIGEEKDIDITFPENYTPELAGKAVVFKIKLNGITTPELPELDDEFAKDVSEFDTLDEYKTSLRGDLEKRKKDEAENDFRANILKQAVNNLQAEIPECMILEKVEQTIRDYASNFGMTDRSVPLENLKEMMGLSDEVVENNIRPAAEFQVKTDLLLDKIKDEEKLEVTEEAFNEYLNKVAEDVKATADQLKNYFGEAFIKAEQLKEMATNLIVDSAKVKAAEAEEKPKKARKPKTPKADDKAEETEAAAEEPKAE